MDLDKLLPSSDDSLSDWSSDTSLSDGIPDDFYVQTAQSVKPVQPVKPVQTTNKVSRLEYKNIIYNIFNGSIPSRCVQYQSPSRGTLWYFYSPSYFLITTVLNNFPHGRCFLYSCPDIQLCCIVRLKQGKVRTVIIPKDKTVSKKKSDVVDDNTVNNITRKGEIYSTDQTLVYKGDIYNEKSLSARISDSISNIFWGGKLNRIEGVLMLTEFAAFMIYNVIKL